ncbi:nucleotide-binding universal stress UspA family protein [Breoghania corrubedonensis]|uniref:Nucleotide-binding universal stress UspA family protein n=1 Tax=Breoghania corrubedonensis TaxID=665038 RepID=A0A2T5V5M1_9HYPH|nr:universal stress protein [Breoghania corrubedonensis]PTW59043.1 nucleotide-binding universal stress UspA family protein [Breoghania corrubedonensis]
MYKRILVPIDLQDTVVAAQVLGDAAYIARASGAVLHLLTVVPTYSMSIVGSFFPDGYEAKALDAARTALAEFMGAQDTPDGAKGHVAHGTIYDEIMKAADKLDCDLIVMASHRPELKDYLLGPNAARVVRHANQSVFVVRATNA